MHAMVSDFFEGKAVLAGIPLFSFTCKHYPLPTFSNSNMYGASRDSLRLL